MKIFSIYCTDKPGTAAIRQETLSAHLTHVEEVMDQIAVAGPMKNSEGTVIGSLLLVKAESETAAQTMLEQDPYYAAGIWQDVKIAEFRGVAGEWVGGKAW